MATTGPEVYPSRVSNLLAQFEEVLYLENRPGHASGSEASVEWIDRAIDLLVPYAGGLTLRGDTEFTNTQHLDRWDDRGVGFIFGLEAHPKAVKLSQELAEADRSPLERLPK